MASVRTQATGPQAKDSLQGPRKSGPRGGALKPDNRLNDEQRKALAAKLGGITPLEFAASVLRDESSAPAEKRWACELLMPYMHRKLPVAIEGALMHGTPAEMAAALPKLIINFKEASEK